MGKTPERRVFAAAPNATLRYRRKVPPTDNQQEPQDAPKPKPKPKQPAPTKKKPQPQPSKQQPQRGDRGEPGAARASRSPPGRRFRPKQRAKQPQSLLKQLLWKAKAVQPAPPAPVSNQVEEQTQEDNNEEDEEAAFASEQRQARKLLASEAVAATKSKTADAASASETFVAESSSQETQSGSEDEVVFLPYNGMVSTVQTPRASWQVYKQQDEAEDTDAEEASPVMPSEAADKQVQVQGGQEIEKAAARRKQKLRQKQQKYKLKQKQKRAAAKEQRRLQQQQQVNEEEREHSQPTEEDATASVNDESSSVDIFHPPTNLASEMDAGVCRAVLSQLKEVVPFIVVGDVACPVVTDPDDSQPSASADSTSHQGESSAEGTEEAVVDFRQHVIAMLDRSKETQMQYRDSFVETSSGFDAAASYDFFKRRFTEVQRSAGIVYY